MSDSSSSKKKRKKSKRNPTPQKILEDALKGVPLNQEVDAEVAGSNPLSQREAEPPPLNPPSQGEAEQPPTNPPPQLEAYEKIAFTCTQAEAGVEPGAAYDEMQFDDVDGKKPKDHTYNEITVHQPGSGVPSKQGSAPNRLTSSGLYEVPRLPAAPPPAGYMSLHRDGGGVESEYCNPDVSRGKRILGSLAQRFTSIRGRGRDEESAPSAISPAGSSNRVNRSVGLVLAASILVAVLGVLLSIVALGISGTCNAKCGDCAQLRQDLETVRAQLGTLQRENCTYDTVTSCTFQSGPTSEPGVFCETSTVGLVSGGTDPDPQLRSVGCAVGAALGGGYSATLVESAEGYSCLCYQTSNNTAAEVDVGCNLMATVCL